MKYVNWFIRWHGHVVQIRGKAGGFASNKIRRIGKSLIIITDSNIIKRYRKFKTQHTQVLHRVLTCSKNMTSIFVLGFLDIFVDFLALRFHKNKKPKHA